MAGYSPIILREIDAINGRENHDLQVADREKSPSMLPISANSRDSLSNQSLEPAIWFVRQFACNLPQRAQFVPLHIIYRVIF